MSRDSKQKSQQRVEQIDAFNRELAVLEIENVLTLPEQDKEIVRKHHEKTISSMAKQFDIDVTLAEKQLTIGMKIVSFLGALAFAASIFFLFYQYWGRLETITQTIVLVLSPLFTLGLTWLLLVHEKSGYFAKIAGLVTVVCFVLNLSMLGQIYNLTPSPSAFILWSILSLGLTYTCYSRLLLAFGLMFFASFLSAKMGTWVGIYWISFGERPENFLLPALVIFMLGHLRQEQYQGFPQIYRIFGALILFIPILILSHWGAGSYLDLANDNIEGLYQISGFLIASGLIWYGIKKDWRESVNTGTVFFTLFLYTKFYDWWWEWLPKYLFFLIIALTSLLILFIFKRLRAASEQNSKGAIAHD